MILTLQRFWNNPFKEEKHIVEKQPSDSEKGLGFFCQMSLWRALPQLGFKEDFSFKYRVRRGKAIMDREIGRQALRVGEIPRNT